jgi:hypothetical protein
VQDDILKIVKLDPHSPTKFTESFFRHLAVRVRIAIYINSVGLDLVDQFFQFFNRVTSAKDQSAACIFDVFGKRIQTPAEKSLPSRTSPAVPPFPIARDEDRQDLVSILRGIPEGLIIGQS